jgi:hypothetical protein
MNKDLLAAVKRVNAREKQLANLKVLAVRSANQYLAKAIEQGQDLHLLKDSLKHGQWEQWLAKNCPDISARSARVYMQVARAERQSPAVIEKADSIGQALKLISTNGEQSQIQSEAEAKAWPPHLEAIARLSRLIEYVKKFPTKDWPSEGSVQFLAKLKELQVLCVTGKEILISPPIRNLFPAQNG